MKTRLTLCSVVWMSALASLGGVAQAQDATPAPAPVAAPAPAAATVVAPAPAPLTATTTTAPSGPKSGPVGASGPTSVTASVEAPTPEPPVRVLRATPTASGGPGDPASVAAGPGGFGITSADKKWEIRFRALVQGDGRFWFLDTQRPEINTFLIRRAQPSLEGRLPWGISFLLNPDFGGGTTVLQDAYMGVEVADELKFRFGKFRPPFGLERLQPTSNLSFVEFGLPTLLTPNRDVGAMVYGDAFKHIVGYAGGIFDGVPDNGSTDLASDNPKEFAGRLYVRPFLTIPDEPLGRLFVGVATTFGRVYGTPSNPAFQTPTSTPAYKTPGQITDFSYITAATGVTPDFSNTVVANGPHNRYGAYLYEALGPFGLLGEYYLSDQEVGRAGKGNVWIHNKAYQAQATFLLFGANASYDFVHVETPFEPAKNHFGALELAARVGHLAIDNAAFPNFASPTGSVRGATEVTLGVNWYYSDNAKFVVNWDHTEFQGGAKTAPELAAGNREAENIILLRAQLLY